MKYFAGLNVSVKEISICIVDGTGKICRELKVASHPEDLLRVFRDPAWKLVRVGLEAGPLSQWLFSALAEAGLPVVCVETRHARAYLKAQVNKTDRNDARGIAHPVHVKTLASQKQRALLTARKLLQGKAIAIENDIRGLLRNFGLKVGVVGAAKFGQRIQELVDGLPDLSEVMEVLLEARRKLREQFTKLHRKLLAIVRDDAVCRRLMTIPGVGAVSHWLIARPSMFPPVSATPKPHQSGEMSRVGRVSLCGDGMLRALLYEGAQTVLTRSVKWSWLKAWAMTIAKNRGLKRAIVALARRLAVIMHRIWVDGTEFRWTKEEAASA